MTKFKCWHINGKPATIDAVEYEMRRPKAAATTAMAMIITTGITAGQRVRLTSDRPQDQPFDLRQGDVGVVVKVSQAHVDVLFARTGQTVVCLASQLEVCDG